MRPIVFTVWLLALTLHGAAYAQEPAPAEADAATGWRLRQIGLLGDAAFRHGSTITHMLPMQDGKRLLTSARDGAVRLWDLHSGKELRRFCHPKGEDVWNLCRVPGRPEILTAGENQCVTRWQLDTGEAINTYAHGGTVFRVALHDDGKRFAACDIKNLCILWDLRTGRQIRRFTGHKESVYTVQFSKDGTQLITAGSDETVRFWDIASGRQKRRLKKGSGTVYTLAPSPDKTQLLVCCSKKSLWKMDAATGKTVWEARLPNSVTAAAWSPDAATIAAVCDDESVYVLNAGDGTQRRRIRLPGETHWSVAFSLDGSAILCGVDRLLCRFDPGTGARIFPEPDAPLQYGGVHLLLPVPASRLLLQAGGEKGIRVQNVDSGGIEKTWLPKEEIKAVAVSPDGRLVLAATDGSAVLLDARTGKVVRKVSHGSVGAVAFTHDGKLAVTGGGKQVTFWRARDGNRVESLSVGESDVVGLAISEDDTLLATACQDDKLRIWDRRKGSQLSVIQEGKEKFRACAFVPSGEGSLMAVSEKYLCYWDVAGRSSTRLTKEQIQRLVGQLGADEYRAREQATRELIKAGTAILPALRGVRSEDLEVQARLDMIRSEVRKSLGRYRKVAAVKRGSAASNSLSFHPDGRHWATVRGSYSQAEILIGEIDGGRLKVLQNIRDPNMPHAVSFGQDGTLYVGNLNGTVSVYAGM